MILEWGVRNIIVDVEDDFYFFRRCFIMVELASVIVYQRNKKIILAGFHKHIIFIVSAIAETISLALIYGWGRWKLDKCVFSGYTNEMVFISHSPFHNHNRT